MSDLADLYSALDSARTTMSMSSQDWSVAPDFAWLYGIFVGWDDYPDDDDPDRGNALGEVARRFRWTEADVERLKILRAAVAGFDINRVADLGEPC